MKRRWIGYSLWLMMTACLYFFENNTGTRAVFLCSLLIPLIPPLRGMFFADDGHEDAAEAPAPMTVRSFVRAETDEPGDVRAYQAGDSIRRIHWKLSAKKNELLVREEASSHVSAEEQTGVLSAAGEKKGHNKSLAGLLLMLIALCLVLLLTVPEARWGFQALCNRVYAASEGRNAYAYAYFPVAENQGVALAAAFLAAALSFLIALTILLRSRAMALCIMAASALFQVYFGLSFPAWANVLLYGLAALWMIRRPLKRRNLITVIATMLLTTLLTALLFPGVDAATETASENVRDRLSWMALRITGYVPETQDGETETRHVHTRSHENGENEARTDREYRLVTVAEEQIAMPHWINWGRTALLFLLIIALVTLPFTPFLLLNARKKKASEERKAFTSENVGEAVCSIFRQVIAWLDETGHGAGNSLYRDWTERLPGDLPEGYADRFSACVKDYEEAAYSVHDLPEEKRRNALNLLKETETALWKKADWKQRLRIRYWVCLCE